MLEEEAELLVDTGAILSWIPKKILKRIEAEPAGKKSSRVLVEKLSNARYLS